MKEQNVSPAPVHIGALDGALRAALPGKIIGVSTYNALQPLSIWLDESSSADDESVAANIALAHDPVLLSVDKPTIQANGTDTATVTVRAPKPGAAAVTLIKNGIEYPVALVDGVATEPISSLDPTTITIAVKNPANRSTDMLTIQAV